MKRLAIFAAVLLLAACTAPSMLVYSSGFTFSNYEYVVIAKPDGRGTSSSLYGTDVELANLLTRYNMKVVGDREYQNLPSADKAKTLFARMSLEANGKRLVLSVSFDDAVTDKTGASITSYKKGNIYELDDRQEVFEEASKKIVAALQNDKGLSVKHDADLTVKK